MFEIVTGWLLFIALIGGLGVSLTATTPLDPDERICLGAVTACLVVYLAAWLVYWCALPPQVFATLPVAAGVLIGLRRRALLELWRAPGVRRLIKLWLILAGWCLGLLALVRSYSGGDWMGDWVEHYQRARFFLEHRPLDTQFLSLYSLPARPPLANLVTGAFLAITSTSFAHFQVFFALLSTLAFLPAALLARHFRERAGGDPAPVLTVLLMLSPLFVQNTTFTWTKLPTVFFTLAGLHFFLRAGRAPRDLRTIGAALCLTAALLTHYSAAPYLIVLALAWCVQRRADWSRAEFWRASLHPALIVVGLAAPWFIWSAWHYGSATFLANTVMTYSESLTHLQQLARRGANFFNLVVPHPLRSVEYAYFAQTSRLGWWRDYFFYIYQCNLPLAFGSGGVIALAALVWRRRRAVTAFWIWFVLAVLILSVAVIPWPDRWGTVHIGLQPMVILGLAWLAAGFPELSRGIKVWLAIGLALDFCLGIGLHYWVQHLEFPPNRFALDGGQALLVEHGYGTWRNFLSKIENQMLFLSDRNIPVVPWCVLLAALLGLALRQTRQPPGGQS